MLEEALGLPSELCAILIRRGYTDVDRARRFLRPVPTDLHPPESLPDFEHALQRIERAIRTAEGILVHGDYDADGMTSAALLGRALGELGARVHTFVPHRVRDGYDLGPGGIRRAREVGAGLIITSDCGVAAVEAVEEAREAGLDVVVTDHHRPGPVLPDAVAVVDPSREDSAYPFEGLAGVGVAFKLVSALFRRAGFGAERWNQHLDLVAIGTVADRAPLVGENRVLVRAGLKVLERTRKAGLRALLDEAKLGQAERLTAAHIGYRLGPRLNSAGRIGAASDGLKLLLEDQPAAARHMARQLSLQNSERRSADQRVLADAEARLAETYEPDRDRVVVLWGDGWHPGVLGITASRIAERLHRPTILVSFDGDMGRGSGRSVEGFNLFEALQGCASTLERWGGHRMAAGLDIRRSRLEEFVSRFHRYAEAALPPEGLAPELAIDQTVSLAALTPEFCRQLDHFRPYGAENPEPRLKLEAIEIRTPARVGADRAHLRCVLADRLGERLDAIGFGLGDREAELGEGRRWDAVFEIGREMWRGRTRQQARLLDFRPANT